MSRGGVIIQSGPISGGGGYQGLGSRAHVGRMHHG